MAEAAAPATPANAALSINEAVAEMSAKGVPELPPEENTEIAATPTAEDDGAPLEEAVSTGDEDAGDAEPVEETPPVIDAPANWDAAAKARFADVPPELQTYLVDLETQRNTAVSTAQREAAEIRKSADADLAKVTTLSTQLAEFLPQAMKTFESKWGQAPDWVKVAEQYGDGEAFRLKAQYEVEQGQLTQLRTAEAQARTVAHAEFVKSELAKLPVLAPDLADPVKGQALRSEVGQYALSVGAATPQDLANVSAAQLAMAHKAMLWDKAQAALKAKTPNQAPGPTSRPSASQPARSSQSRNVETLTRRLGQTGSINDAVALLAARRG